jgi:hypothetical protein
MPADSDSLLRVVNDSGFPLQVAVDFAVQASSGIHGWRTHYREHAWRPPNGGEGGFIDLVLAQHDQAFMVVECKRVTDAAWIFMSGDGSADVRLGAKGWVTRMWEKRFLRMGWTDARTVPGMREALFCAVRGQKSDERTPMLERICSALVASTEGLAHEEATRIPEAAREDHFKIYFPLVVTTAKLHVATFSPSSIPLDTGRLDVAEFEEVPYVRFRKQVQWTPLPSTGVSVYGTDVGSERSSIVYIVNAAALDSFLRKFEILDPHSLRTVPYA